MFVAQGHVGRTMISCDRGKTWVANRSDDDTAVCFENGFDCDHGPGAANGVVWGDGWFYGTFGWGQPGSVRRSHDGVTWEKVVNDTTFGGMAFGGGKVLAGSRYPRLSSDAGVTWTELAEVPSISGTSARWVLRGTRLAASSSWATTVTSGKSLSPRTAAKDGRSPRCLTTATSASIARAVSPLATASS